MKKTLLVFLLLMTFMPLCAKSENSFRNLDATATNGKRITADVFKDYDMTLVCFFVPWCYACHGEIRDLGQLYERLPENINLIMICPDVQSDPDAFWNMIAYFEENLTVLAMTEKEATRYYDILGYPTMCFVDRNGDIIGVNAGGASNSTIYLDEAEKLLKKASKGR